MYTHVQGGREINGAWNYAAACGKTRSMLRSGENGRHARSALSANELPFNTAVEIEMIVEIEPLT